ncbi:hypothetical protein JI721_00115 [Alicyclobacillus cycloheptanicus]|uniref:Uncharacterized protein n=1 Tax=Alicyclobacillus cycloheptanicus TaxID=1457 RepID=A0ABT9XHN5_9BACL|nr:hypothetical protein [Alicyclobacillus cycloheptanicus]MDQ0189288.1 hypothetical protein [Alicyclobacillus cycloheptanicus]WDM01348.1 hypothetical protein JI721_00115 [Alicyclobacillus cycloheptanicus]
MSSFGGEHLSVAKTFYQLNFYLRTLGLPFTVTDLYAMAYKERRGTHYDDRWLDCLGDNPEVNEALSEPFTTHTIVETLMRTGHEPVVRALMRTVRRHGIGFTQAYMVASPRGRR